MGFAVAFFFAAIRASYACRNDGTSGYSLEVAYRDDTDALRARVMELEQRLALSEALVEKLLGRGPGTITRKPDSLVGEVVHAIDEASFEVSLDPPTLEAIARVARERLGLVVVDRGGSLEGTRTERAWLAESPPEGAFGVATNEHGTSLRLESDVRRLPVIVTLGPVLGAMLSMPLVLWQWNALHHFRETISIGTSLGVVVLTMLLGAFASRALAGRAAKRAMERHRGVWAALLEIVRREGKLPRVRVASPDERERAHEEREEREAAGDPARRAQQREHAR